MQHRKRQVIQFENEPSIFDKLHRKEKGCKVAAARTLFRAYTPGQHRGCFSRVGARGACK